MCRHFFPTAFLVLLLTASIGARLAEGAGPEKNSPARVDRYGDPLPPGAIARLGTVRWRQPLRYGSGFARVSFSPDGKTLATGSRHYDRRRGEATGVLNLWDLEAGKQRATWKGHREGISGLAFSPDGKVLATAANDRTLKLWDLKTGKVLRSFDQADSQLSCLAFHSDGKALGYVGSSKFELLDVATGKKISSFKRTITYVPAALSRDLKRIATAFHQDVDLHDTSTGKRLRSFEDHRGGVGALAFAADGKTLAVASTRREHQSYFSEIKLWDPATGRERALFKDRVSFVRCLEFSPDGKLLAVGGFKELGGESEVRLIDVASGRDLAVVTLPAMGWLSGLTFSPDGRLLACASDKTVMIWDVQPAPRGRK